MLRGQILETVNGYIHLAPEEGLFDLLGEEGLPLNLGQGNVLDPVPLGLDQDQLRVGGAGNGPEGRCHMLGLPPRQSRAPGADSNASGRAVHVGSVSPSSAPPGFSVGALSPSPASLF